ncbi:MAG: lipase [Oscillospiraceae bacterium]|nr:lipase [Oscillospiraceae bacterium]
MKILCFGDSNTYGYDPRGWLSDRYGPEDRWPEVLASLTGWEVINAGANGRMIPRNPYALRLLRESGPADVFLVMLGTNDLLQSASAAEAAARMEAFLTTLPCPVVLVTPPPMKRGAWVPADALAEESVRLAQEYLALSRRLGIPCIDTRHWGIELAYDGVHLTESGHRIFAEKLAAELRFLFTSHLSA